MLKISRFRGLILSQLCRKLFGMVAALLVCAAPALAQQSHSATPKNKGKTAASTAPAAPSSNTITFTNSPTDQGANQGANQPANAPSPMRAAANNRPANQGAAPANQGIKNPKAAEDIKLHVDDNNIVELHVNDQDLAGILQMLSIQSQRNIVASKNVSARVTANLYGVTFYEALEAILNVNGYGFIEEGNFIYVYTLDEIAAIVKQNRNRVSKVVTLSYISSVDAAEFVKPLLSETGQIKTNGKTAGFPSLSDIPQGNEEYALSSSIVVYDFEENVAEIEALIKQIDTRPSQVLVEATILQTSLNEANAFGVDFAIVGDMSFSDFVQVGGPLTGPNALIGGKAGTTALPADGGGGAISSTVGDTSNTGGAKVGVVTNNVAVFVKMLDEVTDSTVLSNPKLLALNRQAARVLVGRKVGYLNTTSTDTATTQTVEFLDTGTQLYFRPFVDNVNRTIRMELKPQVSEAVIRDVKNATGAALTIPDEITNELTTNVIVRDGQTIVLGGLFREATTATRRQWPVLGDIPIIGNAFRGREDTTQRSEIIFLITPTIVDDSFLNAAGERGRHKIDQARAGAREGTLKWSRDRITSQLNVEAEKLAAEGDREKALWKLERSLSLDAFQPEVIAMREKITGIKASHGDRCMLDVIMRQEAGDAAKKQSLLIPLNDNNTLLEGNTGAPATAQNTTQSTQGMLNNNATANAAGTDTIAASPMAAFTTPTPVTAAAESNLTDPAFDQFTQTALSSPETVDVHATLSRFATEGVLATNTDDTECDPNNNIYMQSETQTATQTATQNTTQTAAALETPSTQLDVTDVSAPLAAQGGNATFGLDTVNAGTTPEQATPSQNLARTWFNVPDLFAALFRVSPTGGARETKNAFTQVDDTK